MGMRIMENVGSFGFSLETGVGLLRSDFYDNKGA